MHGMDRIMKLCKYIFLFIPDICLIFLTYCFFFEYQKLHIDSLNLIVFAGLGIIQERTNKNNCICLFFCIKVVIHHIRILYDNKKLCPRIDSDKFVFH